MYMRVYYFHHKLPDTKNTVLNYSYIVLHFKLILIESINLYFK
jgi:hypothetical protein